MYEQNDKADIGRYHPTILLVIVSKVIERVLLNHFYPKIKGQIDNQRHGLRHKRSAVLQILMHKKFIIIIKNNTLSLQRKIGGIIHPVQTKKEQDTIKASTAKSP